MTSQGSAAMTRAHQGKPERRSTSGRNSLRRNRQQKAGQVDSRDSPISVEWLFSAGCGMRSHAFPMMPCISAARHFYREPNLKIADFQISSRDWGVKSPASSPLTKNTEVSFKSTQANLALLFVRYENGGEYHFVVFDDYYTIAALFALSAFSFDRKPITHGKAALYVVA